MLRPWTLEITKPAFEFFLLISYPLGDIRQIMTVKAVTPRTSLQLSPRFIKLYQVNVIVLIFSFLIAWKIRDMKLFMVVVIITFISDCLIEFYYMHSIILSANNTVVNNTKSLISDSLLSAEWKQPGKEITQDISTYFTEI